MASISLSQTTILRTVSTGGSGWKRVAFANGSVGRGYYEVTLLTTGGTNTPYQSTISCFKGWSSYGGLNIISTTYSSYWSEARITFDGTYSYLEVNFKADIPYLRVFLDQEAWLSADLYSGTLPNGGGTVITNAKFGRLNIGDKYFFVDYNGNVGIGTNTPAALLTVAGKIASREVEVTVNAGADFVFDKNYPIKNIEEVENFVKENKHLPEIPSAKEMEENGIELGEMNIKLLQKIEELTLYLIEQNKRLNKIEAENKELKEQNKTLKIQQEEIKQLKEKVEILVSSK